jgi:hypothetical protein
MVPAGTVEQMADYIRTNCFGVDADDAFGMDDFYGDLDAFYLISKFKGGSRKLSAIMEEYFTASLTDSDRAAYFLNNRFKALNDQADVRNAILGTYTANTGLKVLEADRGLTGETDLRTACCYAFADYLYELAEGRLEGGEEDKEEESPYYSVFSTTESVLAPGISQTINFATTSDGKIYMRVGDKCEPVRNEDLQRLSIEKGAYQWELLLTRTKLEDIPNENVMRFADDIRHSDRVKSHVKQMSDIEILEHYNLMDNGTMTNLGVL